MNNTIRTTLDPESYNSAAQAVEAAQEASSCFETAGKLYNGLKYALAVGGCAGGVASIVIGGVVSDKNLEKIVLIAGGAFVLLESLTFLQEMYFNRSELVRKLTAANNRYETLNRQHANQIADQNAAHQAQLRLQKEQFEIQIGELNGSLEKASKNNAELRASLNQLRGNLIEFAKSNDFYNTENNEYDAENKEFDENNDELERLTAALTKKIDEGQSHFDSKIKGFETTITELKAAKEGLSLLAEKNGLEIERLNELNTQLGNEVAEVKQLKEKFEALANENAKAVSQLESVKLSLEEEIASIRTERETLAEQVGKLRNMIANLTTMNEETRTVLKESKKIIKDEGGKLAHENENLKKGLEDFTRIRNEQKREFKKLISQVREVVGAEQSA